MQTRPTSPGQFPPKFAVRLAVGLGLVFALCGVLLVMAIVVPTERSKPAADEASRAPLPPEQQRLLELAQADPDYRVWAEVDELTREVPGDFDELGSLARRLEPIESQWSSIAYSGMLKSRVELGQRDQTRIGKDGFLKQAVELVPKLRGSIRDRVLQTILMRNLPSLQVSRTELLAFGTREGMLESWNEGGLIESAEWKTWNIATASKQQKNGRFPKGARIAIVCDANGSVKWASLTVDLVGDSDYLSGLLELPKEARDLRHAERVKQVLAELPPIVRRFLLVAAPEQTDATMQKFNELAGQTPSQLVTGIPKETWMWSGTITQGAERQVKFLSIAGGGLSVSVTQPVVDARWSEVEELTKALGQ